MSKGYSIGKSRDITVFYNDICCGNVYADNDSVYEDSIYSNVTSKGGKGGKSINVNNMPVILFTSSGVPVTWTLSDSTGYFEFDSLPYGNYKLSYEKAGFELINSPTITLSDQNTNETGVQIIISNTDITININEKNGSELLKNIQIYPNPSNGVFNIENPDKEDYLFELINIEGKVIYKEQINASENIKQIDISNYSKGMYYIKINTKDNQYTGKIIVY